MASPFQREAWKRLCAIPSGQRTDAVCRAVVANTLETARAGQSGPEAADPREHIKITDQIIRHLHHSVKRHVGATDGLCRPFILDDVCLNAKGYERLVGQLSRAVGNG